MRYFKRVEEGLTTTVESYSHNAPVAGAVEIDKTEFDAFIAAIPKPVQRDWKAEYAAATSAGKLNLIAERLGLK